MRRLLLLRHAKSSWKDRELDDHERPLNKRGRIDAPRMGRLMDQRNVLPQLALTSSAVRARQTLKDALEPLDWVGEIRVSPRVYAATAEDIAEVLRETPDRYRVILLVGHNPGLEGLVDGLTGRRATMPTAALALIDGPWKEWRRLQLDGRAKLVELFRPKGLPDATSV